MPVIPGGGYGSVCADREGELIASALPDAGHKYEMHVHLDAPHGIAPENEMTDCGTPPGGRMIPSPSGCAWPPSGRKHCKKIL